MVYFYTICYEETYQGGSGGGGGIPGEGGGGSGGIPHEYPCPDPQAPIDMGVVRPPIGNCPPPGTGTPPVVLPILLDEDLKNDQGFYFERIHKLESFLEQDPFGILPCDEKLLMNLSTYGPMYQRIAQFIPSNQVLTRLDDIRAQFPFIVTDNFNIQSLKDASGSAVNIDYFPIQITTMPLDNVTGMRMTPAELVEYFRLNLNSFITSPIEVNFSCTLNSTFNDCSKWNLQAGNALGALCHIHIPGPLFTSNDGTVILSDYQHLNHSNSEQHYFKFSTVETPFDFEHPVAGNREFGIFNKQENPSTYTFYIMGVDRIWDFWTEGLNNIINGFDKADELWTNVQSNLIAFINLRGGSASLYAEQKITARPNWDAVKDYLLGIISFEQLKTLLKC